MSFSPRVLLVLLPSLLHSKFAFAQTDWHPPVCGDRAPAECDSLLSSWEVDVRALQALHRECSVDANGVAQTWTGVWGEISEFSGTREQWDVLCVPTNSWQALSSDDEIMCDRNGRVLLLHVSSGRHRINLNCENGFPPEFEDLHNLVGLRVDGALRATKNVDLDIEKLTRRGVKNLQNIMELSLPNNDLVGNAIELCDFRGGYAFASRLNTLKLNNNKLTGLPPTSLSCAHYLRVLDISQNDLHGSLPDDWADLIMLEELKFSGNSQIDGSLPTSWFPEVSDTPNSYYRLGNLKELDGSGCSLTGALPSNLGGMQKLETLSLFQNALDGLIPSSITRLTNLRELKLGSNRFSGPLPADLFTDLTSSLREIDLSDNQLNGGLPSFPVTGFPVLKDLDVSKNLFEGTLPPFGAVNLFSLNVESNLFSGDFPSPCTSTHLSHLEIQGNAFTKSLPDLSCLPELFYLDASRNSFTSVVSLDWISTGFVRDVNLAFNSIETSFPSNICGPYTKTLDLRGNLLTGSVPNSIGTCVNLHELHLGHSVEVLDGEVAEHEGGDSSSVNNSNSTLPSEDVMSSLTSLTHLTLVGLGLVGPIPTSIFSLPRLTYLDLSENALSGDIPANFSSSTLRHLSLADNKISGTVPAALLKSASLSQLMLGNNLLQGVESLIEVVDDSANNGNSTDDGTDDSTDDIINGFVTTLDWLDLSRNKLKSFPEALELIGNLNVLYLYGNDDMSGVIPTWLGLRDTLKHLRLDGNNLEGSLTTWLSDSCRLIDLEKLRVDGNAKITGPLMSGSIRTLAKLKVLNVSNVDDFGEFPVNLGTVGASLTSLTSLTMSNSGLTGELPETLFQALPNLQSLDLRDNNLVGKIPATEELIISEDDPDYPPITKRVITHTNLQQLLLANNAFNGVFPELPAHLLTLALGRSDTFGSESVRVVVDLRNASSSSEKFTCPLPAEHAAYLDAVCTCSTGSAGANEGRFECNLCLPGTHASTESSSTCTPCQSGYFTETYGSIECTACSPGSAATQLGSTTCETCSVGFFSAVHASSRCDACDPGTFSSQEGSVGCDKCPVGSSAEQAGSSACEVCSAGTFAEEPSHDAVGSVRCQACPLGQYSSAEGQTACNSCAVGYFAATEGSTACDPCQPGSFNDETGARVCDLCPVGAKSENQASTSCDECAPGTFASSEGSSTCTECPHGSFQSSQGAYECTLCSTGYYAHESGSMTCSACEPGTYSETEGARICQLCQPGSFSGEASNECVLCAVGAFASNEGSEECTACDAGTFADVEGKDACTPCASGFFVNTNGASTCDACPAGKISQSSGSAACQPCEPGSFQNTTGGSVCDLCQVGEIAPQAQSTECDTCQPGFFNDQAGGTECSVCTPGTFAAEGSEKCQSCQVGTFAKFSQSNECTLCPKGTYQNITGQSGCVMCGAGSYSNVEGNISEDTCVPCPVGTSTENKDGQATCSACSAGSFAGPEVGNANCILADAGSVAAVSGASAATTCAPGTKASGRGNTACTMCSTDHFAHAYGASVCETCPSGSASEQGASKCNCLAGYRDVSDLDKDEFDVTDGGDGESVSSVDNRSKLSTPVCVACAPGTHTGGVEGSTRCVSCPPDSFAKTNATSVCEKIQQGFIGADFLEPTTHRGARSKVPCPPGHRARDNLVGLALVPTCEQCPDGTVAVFEGSVSCVSCAAGFDSDETKTKCVAPDGTVDYSMTPGDTSNGWRNGGGNGNGDENIDYSDINPDYSSQDLIDRASSSAADKGGMSAQVSVIGFFTLLALCALISCCFARWFRRRRERLRQLAIEREEALDAAEEELAQGGKIRRETLYALANVDAEAVELGEDSNSLGKYNDRDGSNQRPGIFTRLNPFARRNMGRDIGYGNHHTQLVIRAASGIIAPPPRMSVAHRMSRLDLLDRASRFKASSKFEPPKYNRKHHQRNRSKYTANRHTTHDSDDYSDSEVNNLLNDDDEEAVFESVVLAAARRASRFAVEKHKKQKNENKNGRLPPVEQKRLVADDGGSVGSADADDVVVEVDTQGEDGKRPWKMFRG